MNVSVTPFDPLTFGFTAATRLVVGPGSIDRLGAVAREFGATRALVASDTGIVACAASISGATGSSSIFFSSAATPPFSSACRPLWSS